MSHSGAYARRPPATGEFTAVLAGFTPWLARRRVTRTRQGGYRLAIEGFLSWCHSQAGEIGERRRPWCYHQWITHRGASDTEQATTRQALVLFEQYLLDRAHQAARHRPWAPRATSHQRPAPRG